VTYHVLRIATTSGCTAWSFGTLSYDNGEMEANGLLIDSFKKLFAREIRREAPKPEHVTDGPGTI
jgi:hypothetical protein